MPPDAVGNTRTAIDARIDPGRCATRHDDRGTFSRRSLAVSMRLVSPGDSEPPIAAAPVAMPTTQAATIERRRSR